MSVLVVFKPASGPPQHIRGLFLQRFAVFPDGIDGNAEHGNSELSVVRDALFPGPKETAHQDQVLHSSILEGHRLDLTENRIFLNDPPIG